ncbi:MucB/RseB C-terminal domain-containing protein [Marinobacter daepoensis]|uniref:MucB/RseB C-terminal domain-containing protein n=1 Tax=Marinobacter daepoensis TaxID=262077 RepID=A0ABS3BHX8_9GAMM|nr:MucB/RseB C-terminal domain-containing protein [Marinobacter daepoensis]MBN7771428.1 MucB/RseB C-terminal domain-containing protein [Marinobacter daepoensis]MBY6034301.1 MucB/RseB C-terminal domain-containing protein [Marinobacter daepoensis]MBY6080029.1 MucB/RseB C-terminal domain-containing protein [Marinobacter daepoensis]
MNVQVSSRTGVWPVLACLALLCLLTGPARAGEPGARDSAAAMAWLERLGPALNMTSYRGVFVYARGSQVHSMRIAHRYRDGRVEERLVMQDGGSGEIVRKGMDVVCVLPDQGQVRLDEVIPSGPFAEAFTSQLMPIGRWYQPELAGEDRIAGYDVAIVLLGARDQHRYSHRLWLEKETGLLVKSQVRDVNGEVLEHFQFTHLEITNEIADDELEVQSRGREVTRTLDNPQRQESPLGRMNGWTLSWKPEGFMPAAAPRSGNGKAVAFSDGLTAFSVFVEPVGQPKMPTGASRVGATTIYMREVVMSERSFLVAVVGEIPPGTARKVADSVEIDDDFILELSGS